MSLQFLIHFAPQSRHANARIGDFYRSPEHGDLHVYQKRALTREEFDKVQAKLFGSDHLPLRPLIKILGTEEPAADSLPEGVTDQDIKDMLAEIDRLRGEVSRLTAENAVLVAEKASIPEIVEAPTEEKPEEKPETGAKPAKPKKVK